MAENRLKQFIGKFFYAPRPPAKPRTAPMIADSRGEPPKHDNKAEQALKKGVSQ